MSFEPPDADQLAALYAALHTGTPGDLAFYREVCDGAGSVLELGCGAGRVLAALEGLPANRCGIDRDRASLRRAAARFSSAPVAERPDLVCADLRRFAFDRGFDRILLPYNALYCLDDDAALDACLRRVRDHLTPEGLFVFDAYCADALHEHEASGASDESDVENEPAAPADDDAVEVVEVDGRVFHVREETQWDPDLQSLAVTYVYEPRSGGFSIPVAIGHRYLLEEQIEPALRRAGLCLVEHAQAFDRSPLTRESDHYVVIARRA